MLKKYIKLTVIMLLILSLNGCKGEYFGPGMADFGYSLSGSYLLIHAGTTNISKDGDLIIGPNVNGIAWNNNFILARQVENSKTSYYIIDVNASKIYGPLNEKDLNTERNELKVDDKLKLEDPAKYKDLEEKLGKKSS